MGLWDKLSGGKSAKSKFATDLMAGLKAAGDPRDAKFDEAEFRLLFEEDDEPKGVLNLVNLFAEYQTIDKSDREACMREMVRASLSHFKEIPDEFSDASYDLRPRLWTRATFEHIKIQQKLAGEPTVDWPHESIGEHLFLSLVYDLPESVRSISSEELQDWGVTYWEAREVAIANLYEEEFVYASVGDELFASSTGDSYDATRLVMTEMIRSLPLAGEPIAMVPNRDTLLITGSESEVGLKMMIEFATQQLKEQPRPLIATPLILGADDHWEDWTMPANHSLYGEFRKAQLAWLSHEYGIALQLIVFFKDRE